LAVQGTEIGFNNCSEHCLWALGVVCQTRDNNPHIERLMVK